MPCVVALPSQLAFTDAGVVGTLEGDAPLPKPLSAAKARDLLPTNVLCGEERPPVDAPTLPAHPVPADAKAVAAMTVSELRVALRARGMSPAGSRVTLVERLVAGLAAGAEPVLVPAHDTPSGVGSSALSAADARADGLLPEAPVQRGAGPPVIDNNMAAVLSDDAAPLPVAVAPLSDAARAQLASHILGDAADDGGDSVATRKADPRRVADMSGCDIFATPAPETTPWSALKAADYKGNGIFDAGALPGSTTRPLPAKRVELGSKIVFDGHVAGDGEIPPPHLGLSVAKSEELSGGDVFAVAAEALPTPPPMSALKLAELDSHVFEEPQGSMARAPAPTGAPSPPVAAGRARDYGSTCFSESHMGPQPRKEPSPSTAKHAADLNSKASAEGCTMAFAAGDTERPPSASRNRRASGGGASSIVLG